MTHSNKHVREKYLFWRNFHQEIFTYLFSDLGYNVEMHNQPLGDAPTWIVAYYKVSEQLEYGQHSPNVLFTCLPDQEIHINVCRNNACEDKPRFIFPFEKIYSEEDFIPMAKRLHAIFLGLDQEPQPIEPSKRTIALDNKQYRVMHGEDPVVSTTQLIHLDNDSRTQYLLKPGESPLVAGDVLEVWKSGFTRVLQKTNHH